MAYKVQGSRNEYVFDDTFDDALNEINETESQEEEDEVVYKEESVEDVTAKNVEDIIQQNKKHLDEEAEFARKKRIEKDLSDLQEVVNTEYLNTDYIRPYIFYGISKDGKEGSESIDRWIHPEAVREFKEKTGFRCLKIKLTQFHLLWWKYNNTPFYRFVITHLKDDEQLLNCIKKNGYSDWKVMIAKEY